MGINEVKRLFIEVSNSILDYIFPQFCLHCGKYGKLFCDDCLKNYNYYTKQKCFVCSKASKNGLTHKDCRSESSPKQLIVIANYGGIEKKLIHRLKYKNSKDSAKIIAKIMLPRVKDLFSKETIFCPIPLHNKKLRIRGYNQVGLIINYLREQLGKGKLEGFLIRKKMTRPQNELGRKERFENLQDAFIIKETFRNKVPAKIVLVDDLTTSGATFEEAVKILRGNGAEDIICLAFARGQ